MQPSIDQHGRAIQHPSARAPAAGGEDGSLLKTAPQAIEKKV